ncbi:MAG: hypothetical protein QOE22_617 [Candidatus Parcubacteria bacterium]|jgi:hypothetical protein|nr:hypothetical protein [Candidatus Parcubacteria bacterium]
MLGILESQATEKLIELAASTYRIEGIELDTCKLVARTAIARLLVTQSPTEENMSGYHQLMWKTLRQVLWDVTPEEIPSWLEQNQLYVLLAGDREQIDPQAVLRQAKENAYRHRTPESHRLVVFVLVKVLGITPDEAPRKIGQVTFKEHGLGGWLQVFFHSSPFDAIKFAFPEKRFLGHHMVRAPRNYWNLERAVESLQNALRETGRPPEEYPKLLTRSFFENAGLFSPLTSLFGRDRFAYLNQAFPNRYHPWEFAKTPKGYFDLKENVIRATRWLVEEKLGIPMLTLTAGEIWDRRLETTLTRRAFSEHGLEAIIKAYGSPEPILRLVYPDKFLPWSFCTQGKWVGSEGRVTAALATMWLLDEHLEISPLSPLVTPSLFRKYGLAGMLSSKNVGLSLRELLRSAYPELASEL